MLEWLTTHKIPLGEWIQDVIDIITDHGAWFFDAISVSLEWLIESLTATLLWFNPLVLILIFCGIAYYLQRSWKIAALTFVSLLLVINLGYWQETIQTFSLVIFSTLVCVLIGVPLGIKAAHNPKMYAYIRPILDLMQTIPTFVYLIPTMILFGLGVVPGLISTVIFALPAPIRLTYLGISEVPTSLIEAGESFGATPRQRLFRVELPAAMPTIMAGVTQCIMLSLSMVVIAGMVGAPGLGIPVLRALNTVNIAKGFEAGLAIVVIAILLDRVCKQKNSKH